MARAEFTKKTKLEAWGLAKGCCHHCCLKITAANGPPEYDHIIPAATGGSNELENCQVLCRPCHKVKTFSPIDGDVPKIAKGKRLQEKEAGIKRKRQGFATNKAGKWKKKMDGTVVRR